MRRGFPCFVVATALMVAACQTPEPFASSIVPTPEATLVQSPTATPEVEPTLQATLGPQPTATVLAVLNPPFRLDALTSESEEATGQGPVGFTLVIVDATSGAEILGTGQADPEGNFRIALSQPPVKGHLVGLTVDLTQEQLQSQELMQGLYDVRGPGFRMIPQVVTVFDSYPVP